MFIVYNCGAVDTLVITAQPSGKKYAFKRRFVTEVDNKDADYFLKKTSNDVSWCHKQDRSIPPFMKLKDWCAGKKGRLASKKPVVIYDPKRYRNMFLLK